MLINLVLTASLCIVAILGDLLVSYSQHELLKAFFDNGTHAIIGGLTWGIVYAVRKNPLSASEIIWQVLICAVFASIIDIDHFIEAGSFKLEDARALTKRPFLHCTSVLGGAALSLVVLAPLWDTLHTLGWLLCAAIFSHHTRDAHRRGYWLYPMGSTPPVQYWLYIVISALIPYIIAFCSNISKPDKSSGKILHMEEYSPV